MSTTESTTEKAVVAQNLTHLEEDNLTDDQIRLIKSFSCPFYIHYNSARNGHFSKNIWVEWTLSGKLYWFWQFRFGG